MKNYLMFILLVLGVLTACSTLTPEERQALRAAKMQRVENALNSKHYKIDIQVMHPIRGIPKNVSSDWSLEVKGDTLVSYLPYVGRAYNVPYGGGKGMNFVAPISRYEQVQGKKGEYIITFYVDNGEDILNFLLKVCDNGQTEIDVQARERDYISYGGELVTE